MAREQARCKTSQWLYKRGCAHDAVQQPAAEPGPVNIWIDPTPMLSLLFRIAPGLPAFFLWAEFSTRAPVHIAEVWFELRAAPDILFQLLPYPGPEREPYRFPGGAFEISQQQVINRFFPGIVNRHHPVEGYLMGVAFQSLPKQLLGMVAAELSAVDEFGDLVGRTQFRIPLDSNEHGKRHTSRKSKGLYEPLDGNEEPIVPEVPRKPFTVVPPDMFVVPPTKTARQRVSNASGEADPPGEE